MNETSTVIAGRLAALRASMKKRGLAAYIVPGTDPHMSEYVPEHWRTRHWISGFSGSAGTVVITMQDAGLWTDFRYYIQAAEELDGTGVAMHKVGQPQVKTVPEWLLHHLADGDVVGVNGDTHSVAAFKGLSATLGGKGIILKAQPDLLDGIWDDRPPRPGAAIRDFPTSFSGQDRTEKLDDLRAACQAKGADYHLISALDEIAWLLNLRGSDVAFTPFALAHLLLGPSSATMFIDEDKVPEAVATLLKATAVEIAPYDSVTKSLGKLPPDSCILVDPKKVAIGMKTAIPGHSRVIEGPSPVAIKKCCKNPVELNGIREANVRDGVAMARFLHWLSQAVPAGGLTELTVADKLLEFRSQGEHFVQASFNTIAAYGEHGALCHYAATEESAATLEPNGFFLIDSGGQYLDGTTDITRTVGLGPLTDEQKRDFTLVLKCHVQLATARFPDGATGGQLEILGKHAMWSEGADYSHGPGHGLGHFLGVHEGPAGFGKCNPTPLKNGMVLTNEPGLYREGAYGIRTENTLVVVDDEKTAFGQFHRFETLSFCPIDRSAIEPDLLTDDERQWLNDYHKRTLETLEPHLATHDADWLRQACQAI